MLYTDLGFAEQREPAWLTNRYFPSKVGGKPAWLELDLLPPKDQLQCEECQNPKTFLCQIYAPYDDEENFHRTIYVFICRTPSCHEANSSKNVLVLRSQLPRKNNFYPDEPPANEGDPLPAIPTNRKLCTVCGCVGPFSCGRCKIANYCSSQHQRAHWPIHKKICSSENKSDASDEAAFLLEMIFPEKEIVIEPSDSDRDVATESDSDNEAAEKRRLEEYKHLAAEGKTGTLSDVPVSELEKYSESLDDKQFRKFKKTIDRDPDQVIRYKRKGEPLWITKVEEKLAEQLQIPNCENCNQPRQFEFQIMPLMLLHLEDEHLDFGVLAVYTCTKSCNPPSNVGYLREYIVKQDVVEDSTFN